MFDTSTPNPRGRGLDSVQFSWFACIPWLRFTLRVVPSRRVFWAFYNFKTNRFRLLSWILFCDWITGSWAIWRTQTWGREGEQCGAGPRHPQRAEPDCPQQPGCQRACTHTEGASLPGQSLLRLAGMWANWWLVNATLSINSAHSAYTRRNHGLRWSPVDRAALQWPEQPDFSLASHVQMSNVEAISSHRRHHRLLLFLCCFFLTQSLLETHDSVASKNYETPPPSPCSFMDAALNNQPVPPDAVRMVGIRKVSGEHLVSLLNKWFGLHVFIAVWWLRPDINRSNCWKSCTVKLALFAHDDFSIWSKRVCTGSDVPSGERRAGDCQDPPWWHDWSARSAPRRRHYQGGEWQRGGQWPQSAAGDAEGGKRQCGAEDPAQLPGATHGQTG